MVDYLKTHYPNAKYIAAYEAGKFGFWIQRQLTSLGVECLVVNPADIPKSQKDSLQKTDARDARNIGLRLQSGVLRGIHIPEEDQEADRAFFRHRKKILKDLNRCKNRIKGLLAYIGETIPEPYDNASWSYNFINWLKAINFKYDPLRRTLDYPMLVAVLVYCSFLSCLFAFLCPYSKAFVKKCFAQRFDCLTPSPSA
jgi:transposase